MLVIFQHTIMLATKEKLSIAIMLATEETLSVASNARTASKLDTIWVPTLIVNTIHTFN